MTKQYTIKPLEWIGSYAQVPFGFYKVTNCSWEYCFNDGYDEDTFECGSRKEGKSEAEKHWVKRLSEALEEIRS